ncbi:DUF6153 family protein [Streptomyces collinus]|uniref:Uncharacterized protein n=1 Tax=Streptomyces collinus (strain DSM 40733 / Tue 365) TaxID=1214242 RepID=S5UQH4_STRC3|nr:DUF6153 family protein [Streptomyces collinus]AGS68101.1 hypothetical protein B446_06385 [Streptomyces collinus Tu 365]UJA06741.1 hypothetical protein HGI10_06230 [Streptomyces collinus]UJA12089.1 hypothetical protein HGI10_60710 [Streptomyces collinus]UJA13045.1 hypothetical protein HGI09_03390 [Streptomyces collinus]UJA18393.1 hypothetical protein HGI09_57870 [Streptomyces collinus]
MRSTGQQPPRPPRRPWRALLVLAVLAGLFGMHALAPGGGTAHAAHAGSPHQGTVLTAQDDCPGGDGHCGDHRPHHADPTCASGAVTGAPQPPVLVPDPLADPVPAGAPRTCTAGAPDGARAPPSLAELQLLRI